MLGYARGRGLYPRVDAIRLFGRRASNIHMQQLAKELLTNKASRSDLDQAALSAADTAGTPWLSVA
jgi:hypothetical protein